MCVRGEIKVVMWTNRFSFSGADRLKKNSVVPNQGMYACWYACQHWSRDTDLWSFDLQMLDQPDPVGVACPSFR